MFLVVYDDASIDLSDEGETAYVQGTGSTVRGGRGSDTISTVLRSDFAPLTTTLHGNAGRDMLHAVLTLDDGAGWDHEAFGVEAVLDGGSGADELSIYMASFTAPQAVTAFGGSGKDHITVRSSYAPDTDSGVVAHRAEVVVDGGPGSDIIDVATYQNNGGYIVLDGGSGHDTITALGPNIVIRGGEGADTITAYAGVNFDWGGEGSSFVDGGTGDDIIRLYMASDWEGEASFGTTEARGGEGNDIIVASGGWENKLYGNQGDDTIKGGDGADRIIGGQGADYLKGNGGDDVFVFETARGTGAAERDRIADFTIGEDLFDVSKIDAKSWRGGNQSFSFDADGAGRSGTVWVEENPDSHGSIVYANTGNALLAVNLLDGRGVHASDYSADDFLL